MFYWLIYCRIDYEYLGDMEYIRKEIYCDGITIVLKNKHCTYLLKGEVRTPVVINQGHIAWRQHTEALRWNYSRHSIQSSTGFQTLTKN